MADVPRGTKSPNIRMNENKSTLFRWHAPDRAMIRVTSPLPVRGFD
jgi:hypothetical protein